MKYTLGWLLETYAEIYLISCINISVVCTGMLGFDPAVMNQRIRHVIKVETHETSAGRMDFTLKDIYNFQQRT
jgi:hypothetical protein